MQTKELEIRKSAIIKDFKDVIEAMY